MSLSCFFAQLNTAVQSYLPLTDWSFFCLW